jgi:glycosyltransferase involved in cell wall biosynthesis
MLGESLDTPVVVTVHRAVIPAKGSVPANAKEAHLRHLAIRKRAERVFVPSKASRDALLARGFSDHHVHVVPHGLNVTRLATKDSEPALLRNAGLDPDEPYILSPVRGDEHKDPAVVIRFAALLKRKARQDRFTFPRIVLTVSDSDPLYKELQATIAAHEDDLDQSPTRPDILLRSFPRTAMPALYRRAFVCIIPSAAESFGQTAVEAFSFKCPVIAANAAALSEVVRHDATGLHFQPRSADDLLTEYMRVHSSAAFRQQLIDTARKEAESRYSVERMVKQYRRHYSEVLAAYAKRRPKKGKGPA